MLSGPGSDRRIVIPEHPALHTVLVSRVQEVVRADGTVVQRKPVPGDLRWESTCWKRWTGRRWARALYSLQPELLVDPAPLHRRPPVAQERRQRALALAVEAQVANNAASVVLDGPSGVVLGYPRPVHHGLHAVMTLLTGGLWAVVWLALVLSRREDRFRLEVDQWGHVWARIVAAV
jgi:hypothetical protein